MEHAAGQAAPLEQAKPMVLLWEHSTGNHLPQSIVVDSRDATVLFVASKTGGLSVLRVSPRQQGSREIANVSPTQLMDLDAMDVTQQGHYLFVALGDLFDNAGSRAGMAVIDVAQVTAPRVTAVWMSSELLHGTAAIRVVGRTAYLGAMNYGVIALDVTNPNAVSEIARYLPDINFPRPNPNRVQMPNARGLGVDKDRLYVAFDAGGLRVIDAANPRKLREIGRYLNPVLGKKQQAYNNVIVHRNRLYAAVDYCGLEILDVADPANIRQIAWWNPWNCQQLKNLWWNSPGHTNQLALDEKTNTLFLSAGDSEVVAINVARPDQPRCTHIFGRPQNGQGTWGVAAASGVVYLTYIKTAFPFRGSWSGIRAVRP
ncbi:MAG: hypothetical protein R3E01_24045 [Pirellulaceae bacterium]|nr:hypothetical protein [Planctomycetales bacterium]